MFPMWSQPDPRPSPKPMPPRKDKEPTGPVTEASKVATVNGPGDGSNL